MDILLNIAKSAGIIVLTVAMAFAGAFIRCFPFFMSDKPKRRFVIVIIICGVVLGIMASIVIVWT
jgi:VIT1/CCC1 family predicted Fe2+/Mn2+ transporter